MYIPASDSQQITKRCQLEYEWQAQVGSATESARVHVRADNALHHRVPLPDGWKAALQATALPSIAKKSQERAHARAPAARPRCAVLGIPKRIELPSRRTACAPGGIVEVRQARGRGREYLLCAQVSESHWWCHTGRAAEAQRVFDPLDLELLDIRQVSRNDEIPTQKRRRHNSATDPRAIARANPDAFATVVAVARWKVEELCAHLEHRPLSEVDGASGFEANPWRWLAWSSPDIHVEVWSAWSWIDANDGETKSGGEQRHFIAKNRLDNLLDNSRVGVPAPPAFHHLHLMERKFLYSTSADLDHSTPSPRPLMTVTAVTCPLLEEKIVFAAKRLRALGTSFLRRLRRSCI